MSLEYNSKTAPENNGDKLILTIEGERVPDSEFIWHRDINGNIEIDSPKIDYNRGGPQRETRVLLTWVKRYDGIHMDQFATNQELESFIEYNKNSFMDILLVDFTKNQVTYKWSED